MFYKNGEPKNFYILRQYARNSRSIVWQDKIGKNQLIL